MASKLKVDFEVLENTIRQYDAAAEDFSSLLTSLEKSIDLLRNSGWNSEASKAYFKSFDDTWKKNMQDHIKSIAFMRDCLKSAESDYGDLEKQIVNIEHVLDM